MHTNNNYTHPRELALYSRSMHTAVEPRLRRPSQSHVCKVHNVHTHTHTKIVHNLHTHILNSASTVIIIVVCGGAHSAGRSTWPNQTGRVRGPRVGGLRPSHGGPRAQPPTPKIPLAQWTKGEIGRERNCQTTPSSRKPDQTRKPICTLSTHVTRSSLACRLAHVIITY